MRTFLAVELSADIHAALVAVKRDLAAVDATVRWVRDENLHATVKFLGSVPEERLPAVHGALVDAVGATGPLYAEVAGLGVFPTLKRPRVIWAGLRCPALAEIAAAVDGALAPFGFAPETRPFRAHVTLGRVEERRGRPRLEAELRARWDDAFGACSLDELVAFRSDLRRGGAVYTKLWTIPFGG